MKYFKQTFSKPFQNSQDLHKVEQFPDTERDKLSWNSSEKWISMVSNWCLFRYNLHDVSRRPDVTLTVMVDWALKLNYLSIYISLMLLINEA